MEEEEDYQYKQHEEFLSSIQAKLNNSNGKIIHHLGKSIHMMQKGVGHEVSV